MPSRPTQTPLTGTPSVASPVVPSTPIAGSPAPAPPPPPAPPRCWLCENNSHPEAKLFNSFVVEKAHCVDPREMARTFRRSMVRKQIATVTPSKAEIQTHIQRHMLNPIVRMAHILRSLLELSETLREVIISRDDDGNPLIDVRTVSVYLKVISEIMQVYKSADTTRMLFSNTEL